MIILDTNVVSEPLKPNPSAIMMTWAASHVDELAVSSVTIGELFVGVALLPEGARKRGLNDALEVELLRWSVRVAYDDKAARAYAEMRGLARRMGRGLSIEDGMIAGICAANDAALATRNVTDFDFLPITVINPWASPGR